MDGASELQKSLEESLSHLNAQIAEGHALLHRIPPILSDPTPQDEAWRSQIDSWHRRNARILERLFTGAKEYLTYINIQVPPTDLTLDAVTGLKVLRLRLQYLESLREDLPLYEVSAAAPPTPTPFALLDALHPTILERCRRAFEAGLYDEAMLNGLKCVEQALRTKIGAGPDDYGKSLVDKALKPSNPMLLMTPDVESEREAAYFLFRGAIGLLKNPQSHRFLDTSDPAAALEIIAFASALLRRVELATLVEPT